MKGLHEYDSRNARQSVEARAGKAVFVVKEDVVTTISSEHEVVNHTVIMDSWFAWHGRFYFRFATFQT